MVFNRAITRGGRFAFKASSRVLCEAHQAARHEFTSASFCRSALSPSPVRHAAIRGRRIDTSKAAKSMQDVRTELDARARGSYYAQCHQGGLICMAPQVADEIIADFLAAKKRGPAQNVATDIATKYELEVSDIVKLAIATFRVPQKPDASGRLPPSQNDKIAKDILLACSRDYSSDAIIEILGAVYWAPSLATAYKIASHFSPAETKACRAYLEILAKNRDADAMALLGAFLEREGDRQRARELYEAALEVQETIKFDPKKIHQLSLPRIPPWNLLGMLLLSEQDDKLREQARQVFKRGAMEGDDPVSYFHLASFEEKSSGPWLQYMTKAAGSGHLEAMYNLGTFYMDATSGENHLVNLEHLKDSILVKALKWLTETRRYSPINVALEWFQVAAQGNYKPAMWTLAVFWEKQGDIEKAVGYLRDILALPPKGIPERWPKLVDQAERRLGMLKRMR